MKCNHIQTAANGGINDTAIAIHTILASNFSSDKKIKAIILIINESLFLPIFFPTNNAIPENIERCIPESARIWERPAFLKLKETSEDVYSFAPQSNASNKPPPAPQENISLLNWSLHKARK